MNTQKKAWYTSKTIWYAVAVGVTGVLAAIQSQYPELAGIAALNSFAVIALRLISSSEIK